jgi:hypothetical protein
MFCIRIALSVNKLGAIHLERVYLFRLKSKKMNKIKFIKLLPLLMLISFQYAQAQKTRTESDLLGKKEIPFDAYYGVQTLRALENSRSAE